MCRPDIMRVELWLWAILIMMKQTSAEIPRTRSAMSSVPVWKAWKHVVFAPDPVNAPLNLTLVRDIAAPVTSNNYLVIPQLLDSLDAAGITIPWRTVDQGLPSTDSYPPFTPLALSRVLQELKAAGVLHEASGRVRLATCEDVAGMMGKLKNFGPVADAIYDLSAVRPRTIGNNAEARQHRVETPAAAPAAPPPSPPQRVQPTPPFPANNAPMPPRPNVAAARAGLRYGTGAASLPARWWYTATEGRPLPANLELEAIKDEWLDGDYGIFRKGVRIPSHAPINHEFHVYKSWCTGKTDFTRQTGAVKVGVCGIGQLVC